MRPPKGAERTKSEMTLQEMFDAAARGIISQGGKSADAKGECLYRGPDGRKCAVGWLIADSVAEEYEGQGAHYIQAKRPYLFSSRGWDLLSELQCAHDASWVGGFGPGRVWSQRVRRVATRFGLSTTVLDEWESEAARG